MLALGQHQRGSRRAYDLRVGRVDLDGRPLRLAELQAAPFGDVSTLLEADGPTAMSCDTSRKKCSKPAGLMISIMRAGTLPAFHVACSSPPRLRDAPAGTENDLAVARPQADLPLGDDRVLVLASMPVRRYERAHRERMLHH